MQRVVWQYGMERMGPLDAERVPESPLPSSPVDPLFAGLPIMGAPEPVFAEPPVLLRARMLSLPAEFREAPQNDLAGYQHVFVQDAVNAEALVERLRNEPGVVYAEVQPRPVPAYMVDESRRRRARGTVADVAGFTLAPSSTPDYSALQGYLDDAPAGIGARRVASIDGADGAGVGVADIESGWNFLHEDLTENHGGVVYGVNGDSKDHGTAVLGIVGGDRNGFGVEGVAPGAHCSAYSAEYDSIRGKWNAAEAIRRAADRLSAGDVILLEMHAPGPNATGDWQAGFIAIEYWQPEFAAIRYAVARGVHVVEAAGNGGENLDAPEYRDRFDRSARDSGAILVGGGASSLQPDARERIWWSNYGSRLDLQGWGEDIVTTGGRESPSYRDLRDDPDPSRCYTQSFGGTSGASPIVVGSVAVVVGCARAAGVPEPSPREMRELLVATGTPQGPNAAQERIGPLPNLPAALQKLGV